MARAGVGTVLAGAGAGVGVCRGDVVADRKGKVKKRKLKIIV